MKKIFASLTAAITYTAITGQVFADNLNPCPGGGGSGVVQPEFANLCSINADPGAIVQKVIVVLFLVAIVAAIIMIIWNGIRWIISGGDKGKVDAARKGVIAGLIGLVVVLAVFVLVSIILTVFKVGSVNSNFGIPSL